jgi:two-component system cell cycle sensor histidine kinase/response regulator CckA
VHDITETKRLETEIINAKKLEATALLASGIAHDFNNLLGIILGNLELVEENILHGRPVAEEMRDVKEACRTAVNLTKRFLTFSSGGEPLPKCTSVAALISDSANQALAGSTVDSECSFPDGLWPVAVDAGQMSLAIGNVIINAKAAMPQGGVIRIDAENIDAGIENGRETRPNQDAKYVKVTIRDQGTGIPEDILPRVFDPYFTTKDLHSQKGLGLGLTVAYSIMKKHGGSIDIASQQGTGTTITMYLPVSDC